MIQPSSSDDTGGDAVMEGENADERSATDSNPSGPDSRRRIMTKREPTARSKEDVREDDPAGLRGSCHHARGIGRVPRENHEGREHREQLIELGIDFISGMTNCDFSERWARDEMRHIIGSSEPDVIIGSDKDRNRGCKKKDKDHIEFLCELYEAQAAQGRYFVHELTSEASSRMKCIMKIM